MHGLSGFLDKCIIIKMTNMLALGNKIIESVFVILLKIIFSCFAKSFVNHLF